MTAVLKRPPLYRRPEEFGRRVIGLMFGLAIMAYGTAAATSVALSDAETVGGKSYDALNAVPNLTERYHHAMYVVDHRGEIQKALDDVNQYAPDAQQLDTAIERSSKTLNGIATTDSEVTKAWEALHNINVFESFPQAKEHVDRALKAMPDPESIRQLAAEAKKVTPFLEQLGVLGIDRLYRVLLPVADNFASDEIAATLGVMGAAFGLAYALAMGAGFWGRRGRPGLIAGTLQGWGARSFRGWYVRNLEYALSRPLYAVVRERIQSDIVADPQKALDPEALQELERYFEIRLREKATASSGSVRAPRPST